MNAFRTRTKEAEKNLTFCNTNTHKQRDTQHTAHTHTLSKTSFAYSMRIIIEFDNCHGAVGSSLVYFMINFSHSSITFQLMLLPQFGAVVAVCALAAAFCCFFLSTLCCIAPIYRDLFCSTHAIGARSSTLLFHSPAL